MAFLRASKKSPCPICGKADWCLVSSDGAAAICQRTESSRRIGDAGFLHRLHGGAIGAQVASSRRSSSRSSIPINRRRDITAEAHKLHRVAIDNGHLDRLTALTGISTSAYASLRLGWSRPDHAWTFPLSTADGVVVGLNRRFMSGDKRVRRGDAIGLYLPSNLPDTLEGKTLLVTEGGTDTGAALDCGFEAVGRFSCGTGANDLMKLVRQRRPASVVIVADADGPGRSGAERLADSLVPRVAVLKLVEPPTRDLRAWLNLGATTADLRDLINAASPRRMVIGGSRV